MVDRAGRKAYFVRAMSEFFQVVGCEQALADILPRITPLAATERLSLAEAAGRVLAEKVPAPHPLPQFARSAMDGFAIRAADSHGAGEGAAAELEIVGEIPMGRAAGLRLGPGQAALIHTGGMLPPGADAVVPVEHTQQLEPGVVEVLRAVGAGQHVIQAGEDYAAGAVLVEARRRLQAPELGALAACGITQVEVVSAPRVAILSQGDELVEPARQPAPGQVRDINSLTLAVQVARAGGRPLPGGAILPDSLEALEQAARQALSEADLLVISAGSSVSVRDLTARVIERLGRPGVLVHGLAVRPGKPTVVALCDGKPVLGLPGNPVSALVVFRQIGVPVISALLGVPPPTVARVRAELGRPLASLSGREDRVPVRLRQRESGLTAEPVLGKSNSIGLLVRADGLAVIERDRNGVAAGEKIWVELLD